MGKTFTRHESVRPLGASLASWDTGPHQADLVYKAAVNSYRVKFRSQTGHESPFTNTVVGHPKHCLGRP